MTACTARLYDDTGLACTRDEHTDRGHVYVSAWAPDRHSEPDEEAR